MKNLKTRKRKIEKLRLLLQDLKYLQLHFIEIASNLERNINSEENFAKLYTIDLNWAIHDTNVFYKEILDLCIDLYWSKPSSIIAPQYKNI